MSTPYSPPLMITVDEAAGLMSMTTKALYGQIYRGTSGLVTHHSGKVIRVSLKSLLAAAGMTLTEYIARRDDVPAVDRPKIRGAA
ncbi:hypothetical protein ACT3SZ_15590 [Corynebacterium sp. AOP40-9SA-29]|uniref:hypothetical protein n=1 Tax=Corynebacterium sp. AOP40-9SA-29 TaxID=3457677 RepID=UPI004033B224